MNEIKLKLLNKKEKHPNSWCLILCFIGLNHSLKGARFILDLEFFYLLFQFSKFCCVPCWKDANFFLLLPYGRAKKASVTWEESWKFGTVGLFILGFVFSMIFKKVLL